jgi:hypothetical protein
VTDWVAAVQAALDGRREHVRVFVRDDDVGWGDDALFTLLDLFAFFNVPIDLAVIPAALTPGLAWRLLGRQQPLVMHQHGWAHENHEPSGLKCEFGPARTQAQQRDDIARGQVRLRELLGDVPPVFTPPWNRCTRDTFLALRDLGFALVSRDVSAGTFELPCVAEVPITFDWLAKRRGIALSRADRLALVAGQLAERELVGLMLHHAVMDADELEALTDLLRVLAAEPRVEFTTLRALATPHLMDVSAYTASP